MGEKKLPANKKPLLMKFCIAQSTLCLGEEIKPLFTKGWGGSIDWGGIEQWFMS